MHLPRPFLAGLDRRRWLMAVGGLTGAAVLSRSSLAEAGTSGLRTISYNVLACRGYPETDANRERLVGARDRMVERFAIELAVYNADVVTFQESPSEAMVASIAKAMGRHYTYFPGGFPGAVISRFEIVESENCPLVEGPRPPDLFTRHWGRAVLRMGGERLTVYSAHLHPSNVEVRAREVGLALERMAADIAGPDPMLFQGDLNHRPDGPEMARWREAGLVDAVTRSGDASELTFPSTVPVQCIDYIWSNAALARRLSGARVLFEGAFRTNPADERSFALSDHLPVLADYRG
ncbi:MAG: endonuclease/exonuclease/phosphatase family protein [Verrucomicrobiae bacterium]|nr:endonuclease/exonuclease/phosphatase family protein [Verrucomicrobiae bacterium]